MKRAVPVLPLLLAAACQLDPAPPAARTSQPLIGGEVDPGDEAAVALTRGTGPFCTGTLVSPSVVVTAAHCVDMLSGDPGVIVFFGSDTTSDGRKVGVRAAMAHPDWTGSLADGHDIGVVLLNFPQDPFLPIPLNTDPLPAHLGEPIRRIGFGISDRGPPPVIDGKKRTGTTTLNTVPDGYDYFLAGDDNLTTCNGDSGGTSLITIDGEERLAGVHSFGFDNGGTICIPPSNGDTRVAMYVDSFLRPYIDGNDPACGADGTCAPIGCSDDPDCTPCGHDGTCTAGCALPDPDCPTSKLGEICQADSQCESGLCIAWQGDPGTHFCSVPCDPQNDDCPDGMSCQDRPALGNVCYYDAPPSGVVGDDCQAATDCGSYVCEQGTCVTPCDLSKGQGCGDGFTCSTIDGSNYYCHGENSPGGGCNSGGGPPGPLLALAAVALLARRRRG